METIKNVTQLLIAGDQTPTASLEGNTIEKVADLVDGEVVVTDLKNVVFDAASLPTIVPAFKLIQRSGNVLIHSDIVEQGKVANYNLNKQSAEVQQVDYVGYNGTSGALDTTVSNIFTVRLYVLGWTIMGFMQQKIKEGFYKSASSTSQSAIALGLQASLVKNYSREPEQDLLFERINSGAQTAAPTGLGPLEFVNGSKYVSVDDADDATTNDALVVGDLIAVAVGTTNPVYKITAIDATNDVLLWTMSSKEHLQQLPIR